MNFAKRTQYAWLIWDDRVYDDRTHRPTLLNSSPDFPLCRFVYDDNLIHSQSNGIRYDDTEISRRARNDMKVDYGYR
jgi:hypothetical protein